MNRTTIIIIIGIVILISHFCYLGYTYAQTYLVHTYNVNDGLVNSSVNDCVQDTLGRMWFGTRSGISFYDGSTWKSFGPSHGLPASSYHKLSLDKSGKIWALSNSSELSISYLVDTLWYSFPLPETTQPIYNVTSFEVIMVNNQLNMAIGTSTEGAFLYSNNNWRHITAKDGLLSETINGIIALDGQFYLATAKGISIISEDKVDNSLNNSFSLPTPELTGIALEQIQERKKIWLSGNDWIGFVEQNRFHLVSSSIRPHFDRKNHFLIIQPDHRGGVFFGNVYKLFHLRAINGKIMPLGRENGLITEGITDILIDREDNAWFTSLRGVSKIPSLRFANFRASNGLLEDEVSAILEYEPGKFILGHNKGLTSYDGDRFTISQFPANKSGYETRVLDMCRGSQGDIWIAASQLGLIRIDRDNKTSYFGKEKGLKGSVSSVLVDNQGKIWAAAENGLFLFNGECFQRVKDVDLQKRFIRRIFSGLDDSIFLATHNFGVFHYQQGKWKRYYEPRAKLANNVYAILTDSQKRVWVGTATGLYVIKDDSLKKFHRDGFAINRPTYLIIEDRRQQIWFGTDNGVIRWDGKHAREFTIQQGFAGQETNRAAGVIDHSGQVWIGTDLGVSCYQEEFEKDLQQIPPPIVDLLHLAVDGKKLLLDHAHKLSHDQNNLEFYFKGVTFIDEKATIFKVKLDGFDKSWIETTNPQMRYTNLPPGKYRFKLQARNALGSWSAEVSSFDIWIKRPFWKKWWFYILSIMIIIFILYSVQRYYSEKHFSAQLKDQVQQQTAQLQTSLKEKELLLQEIHHRVKNNLQVISSLLDMSRLRIHDQQANNLLNDARDKIYSMALIHSQIYHSKRFDRIEMADHVRELVGYLSTLYNQQKMITTVVDVSNVCLSITHAIPCTLILNELISNAFKHAFREGDRGTVRITMKGLPEHTIFISVKDDGHGVAENLDFYKTNSLGLKLVRNLVNIQLKGKIEIDQNQGVEFRIQFQLRYA